MTHAYHEGYQDGLKAALELIKIAAEYDQPAESLITAITPLLKTEFETKEN